MPASNSKSNSKSNSATDAAAPVTQEQEQAPTTPETANSAANVARMMYAAGFTPDNVRTIAKSATDSTLAAYAVGAIPAAAGMNYLAAWKLVSGQLTTAEAPAKDSDVESIIGATPGAYTQRRYVVDTLRAVGVDIGTWDAVHNAATMARAAEFRVSVLVDAHKLVTWASATSTAFAVETLRLFADADTDARAKMIQTMNDDNAKRAAKRAADAEATLASIPEDAPEPVRKAAQREVDTARADADKAADKAAQAPSKGKSGAGRKSNAKSAGAVERQVEFNPAEYRYLSRAHDDYNDVKGNARTNLPEFIVRAVRAFHASAWAQAPQGFDPYPDKR